MRSPGVVAALLLSASTAVAQQAASPKDPRPSLAPFSSLCIVEESTGFNWNNGKWVLTHFNPNKYVVRKYSFDYVDRATDDQSKFIFCSSSHRDPVEQPELDDLGYWSQGCYSVKRFGASPEEGIATLCSEFWTKSSPGKWRIWNISCSLPTNFTFRPDGQFINYSTWADLASSTEVKERAKEWAKPEDKALPASKDSIYVEHGSCSQVTTGAEK